jgi:hypothetical protein
MDTPQRLTAASVMTATNLRSVAQAMSLRTLTHMTLPEIHAVVDQVSRIVPAGNIPGVILSGLARLKDRRIAKNIINRDINMLFRGVEQALDKAVYGTFFAGPAAVLWGYQNLLKLAGKEPDESFPEGTWQFYVNYALREDTARHANETSGFDTTLNAHGIQLSSVDRISAWTMAAIQTIHTYPALLANEWRERVTLAVLREITSAEPDAARYRNLYSEWKLLRPYGLGSDAAPAEAYPVYRQRIFDSFLSVAMRDLRPELRQAWGERLRQAKDNDLPAYQRQMSLLASLEAGTYNETALPIELQQAQVALIWGGRYYLIPACRPDTDQPADLATVRSQIAAIAAHPASQPPAQLAALARVKRTAQAGIWSKLRAGLQQELSSLRQAPIIINADQRPRHLALAELRLTERGCGDHALTLIDTGSSMVFDQSHIFFDGVWGATLADMLTAAALGWARTLHTLAPAQPAVFRPPALLLQFDPIEQTLIAKAPHVSIEVSSESTGIDLKAIADLRRQFKHRNDALRLTVNDLLIMYRAIHAATYAPSQELRDLLHDLANDPATRPAAEAARLALAEDRLINPALLILVDGSQPNPRDRLHPMSFEVPLGDLKLLDLHTTALRLLEHEQWAEFQDCQRTYLAMLAGFSEVAARFKGLALSGESASVGAMRLMAHLPPALQHLLDAVPGRFDVLNDIIKGREVFSNLGVMTAQSTLLRFITAKDDSEKKTLAWGFMTAASNVLHLSLRDFRPHVALFGQCGRRNMAQRMTNEYLTEYVQGMNRYIAELTQITQTSHKL